MKRVSKKDLQEFMVDVLGYDDEDAKQYGWDDFSMKEQKEILAYYN